MCLCPDRCRVIWQNCYDTIKVLENRPGNIVYPLDCFYLFLNTSHMPGLIRRFYVQVQEIKVFHRGERVPCLRIIIGVQKSGSTRDPDHFHSCTASYPLQEIDCGYDTAFFPVLC